MKLSKTVSNKAVWLGAHWCVLTVTVVLFGLVAVIMVNFC
jgi:hypothetical protein